MASNNTLNESGNVGKEDGASVASVEQIMVVPNPEVQLEETERKARVNAAWEQMNKSIPVKTPTTFSSKPNSTTNKTMQKAATPNWMTALGLAPKKEASHGQEIPQKRPNVMQTYTNDEGKKLAAAALSAVKDAAAVAAAAATGRGKIEVTEVRDFAGEDIEVKKLVDIDSKEGAEKGKASAGPPSAVDAILEQIKKKQKLSVLDKTKKDWGEFKDENKLEEELDAYKKSSNQYLDKVSFLERTDFREFERERDARLTLQSKRKSDMREEP